MIGEDAQKFALALASVGLSVHPLPAGEKKSRLAWAHRQVKAMTPAEIAAHWGEHPTDNIAIITGALSRIVVVDVDPGHGGDPADFIGTTPTVARTRSGGWHFYYQHPGHQVRSRAGVRPGIDVRGDGGYVVAPPSYVAPGFYIWETAAVGFDGLPVYPVELVEGKQAAATDGAFRSLGDDPSWLTTLLIKGAPIGEQRQAMVRLAGYFAGKQVPADVTYAILFGWACKQRQRPGEPWSPLDVQSLVESIYDSDARRTASRPTVGVETTTVDAPPAADVSAPIIEVSDSRHSGKSPIEDIHKVDMLSFGDFMSRYEGQRAEWMVEDWMPQATIAMVVSPPGGFKTWLLCELALSVAMGEPFLRRYPVYVPGPVLFMQQEDPAGMLASRLGPLAISKLYTDVAPEHYFAKPEGVPLYMSTGGLFNFGDQDARKSLVRRIQEIKPVLVILDPLYTACPAGQFFLEMPSHIQWLKRLRDRYGCTFLLAHHTKKVNSEVGDQGREQMWGSNLMNAAIESGWQLRPAGPKSVTIVRHFKTSGNKDKRVFAFEIDVEKIPSMIVSETELESPATAPEERDQLDEIHHLILAALAEDNGTAIGIRELMRRIGREPSAVRRRVQALVQRGLVLRGEDKKLQLTKVDREEVGA